MKIENPLSIQSLNNEKEPKIEKFRNNQMKRDEIIDLKDEYSTQIISKSKKLTKQNTLLNPNEM